MSLNIQNNVTMPQNGVAFKHYRGQRIRNIIPNKSDRRQMGFDFLVLPLVSKINALFLCFPKLSSFINKILHKRCNTNSFEIPQDLLKLKN